MTMQKERDSGGYAEEKARIIASMIESHHAAHDRRAQRHAHQAMIHLTLITIALLALIGATYWIEHEAARQAPPTSMERAATSRPAVHP